MKKILFVIFLVFPFAGHSQQTHFKITITHLVGNIFVHTSYGLPDGKNVYPSNGLYIVTKAGIILIDTPWGEDQTAQLLSLLTKRYHKKVLFSISTHFHADRTGGVDILKKLGIKTYCSELTKQLAKQSGDKQPEFTFKGDTVFRAGGVVLETYYPGEGHTRDNIVVSLPQERVLFGGCLVKSLEADDLGNIKDANVVQYPETINNVKNHFHNIKYVIPGHQSWKGDTVMLTHTFELAKKADKTPRKSF
jgi:metallo-beta-lactamase class B